MKIVTISDSPTLFSGLARVHRHVIDGLLEQNHKVLCCGWFAYDDEQMKMVKDGKKVEPVFYDSPHGKLRVMCVPKKNGMNDMFAIYDIIDYFKPDAVITIGDHWNFWYMRAIKIKAGFSFRWIPYLTVEHDEIEEKWVRLLHYADEILVPSKFGESVLESVLTEKVTRIPYGTEKVFQRPSKRRRKALRRARGCEDKVRFITVAQNTFRKNLPALIQAVKLVCHRDPERRMEFYVHTNIDPMDGEEYLYDLRGLVDKMGIKDRFVFPSDEKVFSVFDAPDDSYMADEYGASDFFVLPSTCEGYALPLCFVPDAEVSTPNGPARIADLKTRDEVYTHTGNTKEILAIIKREYCGDVTCIKALGYNGYIKSTPEHPLFVVRKSFRRSNDPRHLNVDPIWIPACEVKKGDLLVVPVVRNGNVPPNEIDLVDLLDTDNLRYDNEFVWSKYSNRPNGVTARRISEASGMSRSSVHLVMMGKTNGQVSKSSEVRIKHAMQNLRYEDNSVVKTKRRVRMDAKCARLLGLYAAEGSLNRTNPSQICFSFHENEKKLHNDTSLLMRSVLGITSYSEHGRPGEEYHGYNMLFSSVCASAFFEKMVGKGAADKQLAPTILNASEEFKVEFLRGYWEGDGYNHDAPTSDRRDFTTASKTMAWQVKNMLMQLGIFSSVSKQCRKRTYKGKTRTLTCYLVSYTACGDPLFDPVNCSRYPEARTPNEKQRQRRFYRKSIMGKNFALSPVRDVRTEQYQGPVFNMEVKGDNSYCINGFAVHNCEAMACGLPAIANCFSTIPEHLGAKEGQRHGWAERGFLVSNRVQVYPPSRLLRVVRPDSLSQAIWEALLLATDKSRNYELEALKSRCEEYGAGNRWQEMKRELCNVLVRTAGKTKVPVEEL